MKLSGFGDYEQYARWSELPAECFNNRGKFNIDGRRINNSRVTSGIRVPIVVGVEKAARGSEITKFWGILTRARDLSLKIFSTCVEHHCNLTPHSSFNMYFLSFFCPLFFIASSIINCRRLYFWYLFEIRMWRYVIYIIISLTWMKFDWTFMIELKQRIIKDNWRWYEYGIFIILSSNSRFDGKFVAILSTKIYFRTRSCQNTVNRAEIFLSEYFCYKKLLIIYLLSDVENYYVTNYIRIWIQGFVYKIYTIFFTCRLFARARVCVCVCVCMCVCVCD